MAQVEAAFAKAFDRFDRDHSGSIDKSELSALCASLGASLAPADLDDALVKLDKDGSGRIEKGEFMGWWTARSGGADLDGDGRVDAVESQLARVSLRGTDDALRRHIEDIRFERDSLHREILRLDEEKAALQRQVVGMQDRLSVLNESLSSGVHERAHLDSVIGETEAAYLKLLDGSRALFEHVKSATPRLPDPSTFEDVTREEF